MKQKTRSRGISAPRLPPKRPQCRRGGPRWASGRGKRRSVRGAPQIALSCAGTCDSRRSAAGLCGATSRPGGRFVISCYGLVGCAWRAGWRQCTRRRKACHSIFVSFDVRRLFAAFARSFAANCFSPVSPVCSQTAPPTPSFAIPRTTAGLVPLSFASNEVNVKICGGYWGGDGQEETSPGAASAVSRRTNYTPKEHQLGRYSRS